MWLDGEPVLCGSNVCRDGITWDDAVDGAPSEGVAPADVFDNGFAEAQSDTSATRSDDMVVDLGMGSVLSLDVSKISPPLSLSDDDDDDDMGCFFIKIKKVWHQGA